MKEEIILKAEESKDTKIPAIAKARFSLRLQASLITVAISTISILLLGIATYQIDKQTSDKQIKERQTSIAGIFADEISNFLLERYSDIENLSKQAIFIDPKLRDLSDFNDRQRYLNLYLSSAKGIYNNIIFLDFESDRVIIAGEENGIIHQKEEYLTEAISSQIFISQPRKNKGGETIIVLSAPVRDPVNNKIIGIVKTTIPVAAIDEIIKNHPRDENIYLVDNQARIFVTSKEEIRNKFSEGTIAVNEIFPEIKTAEIKTRTNSGILEIQGNFEGEKVMIAYAAVPQIEKLPDLGWYILIEDPTAEALKTEYEIRRIFIVGTITTLVIVGLIIITIAHLSFKPIAKITAAVEKIGEGDLGVRVKIKGKDELAILATNINWMADKIEKLIKTERQNTEKFSDRNNIIANLLNLIRNEILLKGNVQEAAKTFTSSLAKTIELESVSIWLYNETENSLTCLDRYLPKQQKHASGQKISSQECPNYFQNLATEKLLVVETEIVNKAIAELIARHQIEAKTTTILEIPINSAGLTVGILRCEQTQKPPQWNQEDLSFARSIASLIALAIESEQLEKEVEHILEVACSIEEGDLTAKAKVSEHLTGLVADTLNRSNEKMSRIIWKLLQTGREIQQEVARQKQIANKWIDSSEGQTQAAIEIRRLNERVEQIAGDFARQIQQTNQSLLELGNSVSRGESVLSNLTADIDTLEQRSNRIVEQMKTLGEFLVLADRFVEDQSQIASLTQVLAMNASLVAARASEQKAPGEFALVSRQFESIAKRVSGLAQTTDRGLVTLQQRSTEIHKAVSGVEVDTQNLGQLIKGFTKAVEQSEQVFANLQTVSAIASNSDRTATESSQSMINAARSMAEVMENMAELASETTQITLDTKRQSEKIENRSKQLVQIIEFFQLTPRAEQNNSNSFGNSQNHLSTSYPEENSIYSLDFVNQDKKRR